MNQLTHTRGFDTNIRTLFHSSFCLIANQELIDKLLNLLYLQEDVDNSSTRWLLIICECGNHFGSLSGKNARCNICGETNNLKTKKTLSNSSKLADEVSQANIPKEIHLEIKKRLAKEKKTEHISSESKIGVEKIHHILKESTNEKGVMEKEIISLNLANEGITTPSLDYIMGVAEEQGVVIRVSSNSWRWV